MSVGVMRIRHVRMAVSRWRVLVRMAVLARRHGVVPMLMVPIIMPVRVLVR